MKTRFAMATLAAIVLPALLLGACTSGEKTEDPAMCQQPKPGAITSENDYCVIMNADPVDPELTREWNGHKVGFCCKGCLPKWDALSDAEKQAALDKAIAKGKVKPRA